MIKYVSILRGINVGGHRKILMKDLKELYLELGVLKPLSYIQSGNVIFETNEESTKKIETLITNGIKNKFGFDVPVLVRTVEEFRTVVQQSPYFNDDVDMKSLYFTFLSKVPIETDVKALSDINFGEDTFKIIGKTVHAFINPPYHKSKFSNQIIEKKLNCKATTRNWKTVNKLIELSKS